MDSRGLIELRMVLGSLRLGQTHPWSCIYGVN